MSFFFTAFLHLFSPINTHKLVYQNAVVPGGERKRTLTKGTLDAPAERSVQSAQPKPEVATAVKPATAPDVHKEVP